MGDNDLRNEEPGGLGINGHIPGDGTCVVAGCGRGCPENALMCRRHWRLVPPTLKENMQFVFRRWRRNDDITLQDVRDAQWACVESLAGAPT